MDYQELAERLSPEAADLFREMVPVHLDSRGDRRFMLSANMSENSLQFVAHEPRGPTWTNIDRGAFEDLVDYGLLRVSFDSRGTPTYRITGEGLAFYRWWMA